MKLNVLALSTLLAFAAAQTTTTTAEKTTTTLTAEAECAKSCTFHWNNKESQHNTSRQLAYPFILGAAKDVCCIAKCYKVPCPSDSQVDDTNSCVAKCPQGTGTPSDTKKYTDCQQACFSSHYFPIDGATATGSSSSESTASGSEATATGSQTSTETGGMLMITTSLTLPWTCETDPSIF